MTGMGQTGDALHVLGIDAGGTKTVCLLADGAGSVVSSARGPGANLQAQGELEVEKVLHEVMESALAGRPIVPAAICLGIAGVDRPDDAAIMRGIMRRIGTSRRRCRQRCAGGAHGRRRRRPRHRGHRGTGSICYGRNEQGQAARGGGWGYILGDEGSGYWIGRRALAAVVRHADGRGPATTLTAACPAALPRARCARPGAGCAPARPAAPPRRLASPTPCRQPATKATRSRATSWTRAGDELVAAAGSVAERLAMRGARVSARPRRRGLARGAVTARAAARAPARRGAAQPAATAHRRTRRRRRALALAEAHGGARLPQYV